MRRWLCISAAVLVCAFPARAEEAEKENPLAHFLFGGTLEGYYEHNDNDPHTGLNDLRSYDQRDDSFGFQQATVVIESPVDVDDGRRWGARVDLQFGQATDTLQGNPANEPRPETWRNVWQAYGTYVFGLGNGLTTDFGKFGSNLGYETNYAKDNNNFTRALLFQFLPFYHMGLRLSYPVTGRLTAMYMLTNGAQQTDDFNDRKASHLSLVWKPVDALSWTASYFTSQEPAGDLDIVDTYASYALGTAWSFGLDLNHTTLEDLSLDGIGAYARWQVSSPFALAVRYEHLDDEGLFAGVDETLQEGTVTAEYKFEDGFLLRAELRRDWSDRDFFTGSDPAVLHDTQDTALLGFVWWFGNKKGAW
jgi:hypothetical protein